MKAVAPPPDPEPRTPPDEHFDIFAGAGEYTGLELSSDEDEDANNTPTRREPSSQAGSGQPPRKGWFDDDRETTPPPSVPEPSPSRLPAKNDSLAPQPDAMDEDEEVAEEPTHLQPLMSSALPSIRDFLAADEAMEKEEKRRARKEKKKGKGGGGGDVGMTEAQANRDYQKYVFLTDLSSMNSCGFRQAEGVRSEERQVNSWFPSCYMYRRHHMYQFILASYNLLSTSEK